MLVLLPVALRGITRGESKPKKGRVGFRATFRHGEDGESCFREREREREVGHVSVPYKLSSTDGGSSFS